MSLRPNFEQYKTDQAELERVPIIKPDFHFVINDISEKILNNQELTQEDMGDLEIVHDLTQALEKNLVTFMEQYRSWGVIAAPEFLAVTNYFLTAKQNGPDSNVVRDELISSTISVEDFQKITEGVSMPGNTRKLLVVAYEKILRGKKQAI